MSLTWEVVVAHALSLPNAEFATYFGGPAVKANDRPVVTPSREAGSFCLHIDTDKVEMLKDIDPDTFWQTPHYEGWPAVLVRYASPDPKRVRALIAESRDWTAARPKARPRKRK